jgi:transcriptional regulator with XRE-family HTH domain
VSRAYINKVLQGSANLTIESLVKLSRALDCDFKFRFVGKTKEAEIVEKGEEVDIIDAEIIYIKHKPISQNETVPQNLHHGYKPNGFYNFEDYKYKKVTDISLAEVQF